MRNYRPNVIITFLFCAQTLDIPFVILPSPRPTSFVRRGKFDDKTMFKFKSFSFGQDKFSRTQFHTIRNDMTCCYVWRVFPQCYVLSASASGSAMYTVLHWRNGSQSYRQCQSPSRSHTRQNDYRFTDLTKQFSKRWTLILVNHSVMNITVIYFTNSYSPALINQQNMLKIRFYIDVHSQNEYRRRFRIALSCVLNYQSPFRIWRGAHVYNMADVARRLVQKHSLMTIVRVLATKPSFHLCKRWVLFCVDRLIFE